MGLLAWLATHRTGVMLWTDERKQQSKKINKTKKEKKKRFNKGVLR